MSLYRSFDVWKRSDEQTLVRYRVFQVLPDGGFGVQSADFYRRDDDEDRRIQLERQFVELLLDIAPDMRSALYASIDEAVRMHDDEFRAA